MAMGSCGSGALLTSLPHPLSLSLVWVPSLWGVPSFRTGDFLQFSLLDQSSQTVRPLTVRYRLYCALAARLSGRGPVAMVPYFPLLPPLPQGLSRVLLLWYLHFKTQTSAPFSNLWSFAGGSEVQPSLPQWGFSVEGVAASAAKASTYHSAQLLKCKYPGPSTLLWRSCLPGQVHPPQARALVPLVPRFQLLQDCQVVSLSGGVNCSPGPGFLTSQYRDLERASPP